MKNTELMVGNYLQRVDGSIVSVKRLIKDDNDILVNETQGLFTLGYTALPIPLTEEILFKCGFEKDDFSKTYVRYSIGNFNIINDTNKGNFICDGIKYMLVYVEYIHQLQNLYFLLTKKELKIEL